MGTTSSSTTRTGRGVAVRTGVVAAATILAAAGGAGVAQAAPATVADRLGTHGVSLDAAQLQQVRDDLAARREAGRPAGLPDTGPASFFLELATPATSQAYADALPGGQAAADQAARAAKPAAQAAADQVVTELPASVPDADVLYTASTVLTGVAVSADAADYEALAALPQVTAVHAITPKKASNTGAAAVVQAVQAWQDLGNTGEGVRIGIIDTGIDYTHADFGGSGDPAEFAALTEAEAEPAPEGVYPNAKVVGGHDFVGNGYDAATPGMDVPVPDDNPLDCNGHGSHVAGTAAGFGVNADGSTYTGGYGAGFDPAALSIGPGMAPEASLYALKVFGCEGSTDVTIQAIEWAMDPDGDGSISDHLDVVNLSLGSDYGLPDDADALAADKAMEKGMLVVMSAGNAGDSYDIGGSPGNAPRGIGVAASNDGYGVFDGWQVVSGTGPSGVRPGLRSVSYSDVDPEGNVKPDVTAPVVLPQGDDDPTACAPWTNDYAGQIVLIEAAGFDCGSITKGGNARDHGAAGFMIIGDDDLLEVGITGVPEVPGILTTATDGAALAAAVAAGPVTVTFGPSFKDAAVVHDPAQVDLLASFSSRGTRQAGDLKPDVTAPGVTLYSAAVGTGTQGISESGTSMAAPTAAGVTALIRKAHPHWSTEEVKADLMNTAGNDLYTQAGQTGAEYGPNRVGAGRIDAVAALSNSVLAYAEAGSGTVSASFGVVEVADEQVRDTRTITVANKGDSAAVYRLDYEAAVEQPGVEYALSAQQVTVPPRETRTVTLTMTAVQDELLKVADPTVVTDDGRQFLGESSGRVVLSPVDAKGSTLRVPVHSNAKPSSTLTAEAAEDDAEITLSGEGVANGPAYEPGSYTSLVSAFEQLGTSPELKRCKAEEAPDCYKSELERSVDLAAVGITSDVQAYPDDPGLYVAVAAHGRYTSPETVVNYGVYLDATGDGAWDYQVTTTRMPDLDLALVVVTDRDYTLLPNPSEPYIGVLNLVDGQIDTNAFDNDVQVMGVPLSVLPLVEGRVDFGVQAISAYGTVDDVGTTSGPEGVELSEPMSFDPLAPGLTFTGAEGDPALLLPATDGTTITVTEDPESYADDVAVGGDKGALVVLPHNDTETGRAQSVPIGGGTPPSAG